MCTSMNISMKMAGLHVGIMESHPLCRTCYRILLIARTIHAYVYILHNNTYTQKYFPKVNQGYDVRCMERERKSLRNNLRLSWELRSSER